MNFRQNILVIFVISALVTFKATGEPLECQDLASFNTATQMCDCGEGRFYNAWEGKCQGICSYFGDSLCHYTASNIGICLQEYEDSMNFTCGCPEGFYPNQIGGCSDLNQCEDSEWGNAIQCPENENCTQLDGVDTCSCVDNYYRASNGVCYEINLCDQPKEKPCDQICTMLDDTFDYQCDCFSGYMFDEGEGKCVVDPDSDIQTNCTCDESHPAWAVCYVNSTTGENECNAIPGYLYDNGQARDIDECADEIDQCSRGYTCTNEIGSYDCDCGGVTDDYLGECFGKVCDSGHSYYNGICQDPCSEDVGFTCPAGFSCFTNEQSLGECRCQISCQLNGKETASTYSVYNVSFTLPNVTVYSPMLEYNVMKSMEIMFGPGNSEIIISKANSNFNGFEFKMSIGIMDSMLEIRLQEVIRHNCYNLTDVGFPGHCMLPNGILVAYETILVAALNACEHYGSRCDDKNAICRDRNKDDTIMPGIYMCVCSVGYEEVVDTEFFYCEDIDECKGSVNLCPEMGQICQNTNGSYECVMCCEGQIASLQTELYQATQQIEAIDKEQDSLKQQIDDEERRTTVVGGVLGALAGVALVALLVAGVYIYSKRSS